jgi:hypothetical protein
MVQDGNLSSAIAPNEFAPIARSPECWPYAIELLPKCFAACMLPSNRISGRLAFCGVGVLSDPFLKSVYHQFPARGRPTSQVLEIDNGRRVLITRLVRSVQDFGIKRAGHAKQAKEVRNLT